MKKSITILEDDRDIRELCAMVFAEEGYTVKTHYNVSEFSKDKTTTNLFLLDIQLPDGNGLDVCEELKNDLELKHIPVIMMSANLRPIHLLTSRADGFIEKPFDIERLLQRVAKLID